jgi:hypothetical protein
VDSFEMGRKAGGNQHTSLNIQSYHSQTNFKSFCVLTYAISILHLHIVIVVMAVIVSQANFPSLLPSFLETTDMRGKKDLPEVSVILSAWLNLTTWRHRSIGPSVSGMISSAVLF